MSKIRQILKLYCEGYSKKSIVRTTGVARNTVKSYIHKFNFLRTTWAELSDLSDQGLEDLFLEEKPTELPSRVKELYAFYPYVEKQLRRRGMTLYKLWGEYHKAHPEGFAQTSFYRHFSYYKKKEQPVMHFEHKSGEKVFVDYAGEKMQIIDKETGEVKKLEVFIAILGASQLTYVEATEGQGVEDFIGCCENALRYFGGAPRAIVTDNLKASVIKSSRYEPQVNSNFEAFADHYGMAVLPTRSYKPRDKAHVENAVKIAYRNIYTEVDKKEFYVLDDLNTFILPLVDALNKMFFQGRDYGRRDQFEENERATLQPLPELSYELHRYLMVTVMKNSHICITQDKHYYSVPFAYLGKKVKVLYSRTMVKIYHRFECIARHKRVKSPHNYSTTPEHMPSQHRYLSDWNPEFFLEQAGKIHADVEYYFRQILIKKAHPEQAYKSCSGILSLSRKFGPLRLTRACQRAHEVGYYNYKTIEDILKKGLDKEEAESVEPLPMPAHENIRGSGYYE